MEEHWIVWVLVGAGLTYLVFLTCRIAWLLLRLCMPEQLARFRRWVTR
jgi:hypothetical protein